jgi:hypothetical protein
MSGWVETGAPGAFLAVVEDDTAPRGPVPVVEGLDRPPRAEPPSARSRQARIVNAGTGPPSAATFCAAALLMPRRQLQPPHRSLENTMVESVNKTHVPLWTQSQEALDLSDTPVMTPKAKPPGRWARFKAGFASLKKMSGKLAQSPAAEAMHTVSARQHQLRGLTANRGPAILRAVAPDLKGGALPSASELAKLDKKSARLFKRYEAAGVQTLTKILQKKQDQLFQQACKEAGADVADQRIAAQLRALGSGYARKHIATAIRQAGDLKAVNQPAAIERHYVDGCIEAIRTYAAAREQQFTPEQALSMMRS